MKARELLKSALKDPRGYAILAAGLLGFTVRTYLGPPQPEAVADAGVAEPALPSVPATAVASANAASFDWSALGDGGPPRAPSAPGAPVARVVGLSAVKDLADGGVEVRSFAEALDELQGARKPR